MNQIYHTKVINNPLESWCAKIAQKPCFFKTSRARAKSRRDFAKGFGPGKNFPVTFIDHQRSSNFSRTRSLNSRSANSHLRDDAFFGTWRDSSNFVRDSSPGGVRLSGAIRPSSDVIQEVRDPPGGEELGKNTRRALPKHLAAMRTLYRRFLA